MVWFGLYDNNLYYYFLITVALQYAKRAKLYVWTQCNDVVRYFLFQRPLAFLRFIISPVPVT
jgi:hypothetical protein